MNIISPLTFRKTIRDQILQCDNNFSFDEFTILAHKSEKYLLETKESILSIFISLM